MLGVILKQKNQRKIHASEDLPIWKFHLQIMFTYVIYLFWLFFSEQIFIEWWNCGHLEQFLFVIIEQKQSEISNSLLLQL